MKGLELAGLQDTFPQRPNDRLHTHQFSDLLGPVFPGCHVGYSLHLEGASIRFG
jgi:hypothetical protein